MELRTYQKHAVTSLFKYFEDHAIGNPLIVCPTASGKSVIQADFVKQAFQYPNQRWLLLSHVMELIDQNHKRIIDYWPSAPTGIYCAKLKKKETDRPITVASIQSIHKKAHLFGYIDGIIVDEAHLIGEDQAGMYRRFFEAMQVYNPNLKVIGLTATPFRLKSGFLHEGKNRLFTDIAFSISIGLLLREGYICPLRSKQSKASADLSKVKTIAGEFSLPEMESVMNTDNLTQACLDEVCKLGSDRKAWLFFCSSVDHAYVIRDELRKRGIKAETVNDKLPDEERKRILKDFQVGEIQALTNMSILTTGYDCPRIDLLVLLRGTKSPSLYIQVLGRGMRLLGKTYQESIANGKRDCLVLDYGGNIKRFGPINMIEASLDTSSNSKKKSTTQGAPCKECPICQEVQSIHYATCSDCGHEFPKKDYKHDISAAIGEIITDEAIETGVIDCQVDRVKYSKHTNKEGIPSFKIEYTCGLQVFTEWLPLESPQMFRRAYIKWSSMAKDKYKDAPTSVDEALTRLDDLMEPAKISVVKDGKYWKVIGIQSYKENITEAA